MVLNAKQFKNWIEKRHSPIAWLQLGLHLMEDMLDDGVVFSRIDEDTFFSESFLVSLEAYLQQRYGEVLPMHLLVMQPIEPWLDPDSPEGD